MSHLPRPRPTKSARLTPYAKNPTSIAPPSCLDSGIEAPSDNAIARFTAPAASVPATIVQKARRSHSPRVTAGVARAMKIRKLLEHVKDHPAIVGYQGQAPVVETPSS